MHRVSHVFGSTAVVISSVGTRFRLLEGCGKGRKGRKGGRMEPGDAGWFHGQKAAVGRFAKAS